MNPSAAPTGGYATQPMAGMPGMGMSSPATGTGPRPAGVMAAQLDALIAAAEGKKDDAIALAQKAAGMEDAISFDFGPPMPIKPSHELLGEMLLDADRFADAQKEFAATLKRTPGRTLSLIGLYRAATQANDLTSASRAWQQLHGNYRRADPGVLEVKDLRFFIK
jgi:hypothetical protein